MVALYADMFGSQGGELAFGPSVGDSLQRFRADMAEHVGMGIAWYWLVTREGAVHIADVECAVSRGYEGISLCGKAPDLLARDIGGKHVIVESKGSASSRSCARSGITKGLAQTAALHTGHMAMRACRPSLVISSFIAKEPVDPDDQTVTLVADPPVTEAGDGGPTGLLERVAYAKFCRYAGRVDVACRLLEPSEGGDGWLERRMPEWVADAERFPELSAMDLRLVGVAWDGSVVLAYHPVWDALCRAGHSGPLAGLDDALGAWHQQAPDGAAGSQVARLPNGFVLVPPSVLWDDSSD